MEAFSTLRRAGFSLGFVAGDIWAVISWIWGNDVSLLEQIGPPEYAVLITLFTGALLYVNWSWINALLPSNRLKALYEGIRRTMNNNDMFAASSSSSSHEVYAEERVLRHKLEQLRIVMPTDRQQLEVYLPDLLAYAKLGQIKEARLLEEKLQSAQEDRCD